MTPAVKVWHPNHWTAREVPSFPSLSCPMLLLHRSPPVSLLWLSLSLTHPQATLPTHTPQVCEWQSLTSPPHPGAPQWLSLKQPEMEITHQEACSSSIPAPPPDSHYFDFLLVCDPGTVGLFPTCPYLFPATGSLVPSALQPFQALFTLMTLWELLSLPQVPVARTALRKARTLPCPRCPTAPAQGYSAGCRQDSP